MTRLGGLADDELEFIRQRLRSWVNAILGGTSEILLNVIAKKL
ncbi:MAG: hypothetical protein ACJAX5_002588 [Patiriisocius sp.]|jgi:hypothetical protein